MNSSPSLGIPEAAHEALGPGDHELDTTPLELGMDLPKRQGAGEVELTHALHAQHKIGGLGIGGIHQGQDAGLEEFRVEKQQGGLEAIEVFRLT